MLSEKQNRLIHDYFGVDYRIVWDVAKKKLPPLARRA
ncbi:MAG: HepT-like ribonuclease domain-containing protein [Synergistota bacterium]|nr:HepT-like ribonuclease domain-containing protein [Synergistota bacterium]